MKNATIHIFHYYNTPGCKNQYVQMKNATIHIFRYLHIDDIRQAVREELSEVSFVQPVLSECKTAATELTEEQKAKNKASVLSCMC